MEERDYNINLKKLYNYYRKHIEDYPVRFILFEFLEEGKLNYLSMYSSDGYIISTLYENGRMSCFCDKLTLRLVSLVKYYELKYSLDNFRDILEAFIDCTRCKLEGKQKAIERFLGDIYSTYPYTMR